MNELLICHATHDGLSRRIAERVAEHPAILGLSCCRYDLAVAPPDVERLEEAAAVVLVAAVRYGHHLPAAESFVQRHRDLLARKPVALASVNLVARKPGRDTPDGNPYLRKWLARHRLNPAVATAFAGALDYARHGWLDRLMIRAIMRMTGGPTDPASRIEYTDWARVGAFAEQCAALARTASAQRLRI
ncbi:menaquinone-dependent protoporphyrinogen IX dehydrogenase [Chitiniphilus eburneus]|uniref:Protoporphyrinogen IX dehydrogenase [quinone] n=1 Tax=Chitiniphilus eburneus TaxID=2571148 RepID=A0A4U0PTZ6_9NEIS|nr:menaquinone-dependent protoporphyrinogen IX dehydrogenase [Chitiniphilus eburneus]TJZ71012.1 menaquinone-dependent protoporphyrinogen IX dehydrogenase [Chitiniphilus eburneus]